MIAKKHKKVVVVGAGMAGLATAKSLQAAGFEVLVLEANHSIGGRTTTDYSLGFPCDRGAAWIHGIEGNPIAELAEQLNLSRCLTELSLTAIFDRKNHLISTAKIVAFDEQFNQYLNHITEIMRQSEHDMPFLQALQENLPLTMQPGSEFYEIYLWRLSFLSLYYGIEPKYLSARDWDLEERLPGGNFLMTMGYQSLVDYLAKDIAILINEKVQRINYGAQNVTVFTPNNKFDADAVVVTVPLGVLKNNIITFDPPLPEKKQASIQRLGMGLLNKVALKFPEIFWPTDNTMISYVEDHYQTVYAFVNYAYYLQQPVLIGYMGGEFAKQLENLSDTVLIQQILQKLRKLFGKSVPEPTAYFVTRWNQNPYSFGSYSYTSIGAGGDDYDTLAESVAGRVFFAGEATNKQFAATTHGAYLSGLREAGKVIKSFAD